MPEHADDPIAWLMEARVNAVPMANPINAKIWQVLHVAAECSSDIQLINAELQAIFGSCVPKAVAYGLSYPVLCSQCIELGIKGDAAPRLLPKHSLLLQDELQQTILYFYAKPLEEGKRKRLRQAGSLL